MTVLADYEVIPTGFTDKNEPVFGEAEIGDAPGINPWTGSFDTGGRLPQRKFPAFITLMVRGIVNLNTFAPVEINEHSVGFIFSAPNSSFASWRTQSIVFDSSILNSGQNRILIKAVQSPNPSPGDIFDNFRIRNVMCFFRQDSD